MLKSNSFSKMSEHCSCVPCSFIEFDTGINGTFVSFLQVYKLSISVACALTWPPDRIIIQVLDDSTDPIIKVHLGYRDMVSLD